MSIWTDLDKRARRLLERAGWCIGWLPADGGGMRWVAARRFQRVEAPTLHKLFEAAASLRGGGSRLTE